MEKKKPVAEVGNEQRRETFHSEVMGPRLKAAIKKSGKSYREIGEEAGVSFTMVNKYANGNTGYDVFYLGLVCDAIGVKLSVLLEGVEVA